MRVRMGILLGLAAGLFVTGHAPSRASDAALAAGHRIVAGEPATYLTVRLDDVRVRIGLGEGRPGRVEALDGIARRYHALAAINGGDYEAYGDAPIRDPNHTLITGGSMMFKGDVGDVLWFDDDGHARIDRIPLKIEGGLDGRWTWPNNWYAYWINRYPAGTGDTITIFTPEWGERTGLAGGPQVQVADGVVTAIQNSSTIIPRNGFVVYFRGEAKAASHFAVGRTAQYRVVRADGEPMGAFAFAREAIGCGPRLVTDGRITVDPAAEGFRDPKILSASAARSAVGLSRDGKTMILATSEGTIARMAAVMRGLGAYQAMAFDGGASAGLWLRGRYVTEPGRPLNNALLVLAR
ncbi:MAG TPA: phosphodiester glycosidase family protein [Candidatus Elarobacter sp.]|nr:phosphodiester glycosidase family protein [Candidatus Elarobacter sp.]